MKKINKKFLKTIIIIFVVLIIIGGGIIGGVITTQRIINKKYNYLHNVEFTVSCPNGALDGNYKGEFSYGKNIYYAYVQIENGVINNIEIDVQTKESNLKYIAKAKVIIDDIISKQSLDVDTVSGATRSSNCIRLAIEDALKKSLA